MAIFSIEKSFDFFCAKNIILIEYVAIYVNMIAILLVNFLYEEEVL